MGEPSTSAAMCKVCGHRHRMMDPHTWDDEPKANKKATIEALKESVARVHNAAKEPKERVHNISKTAKERVHKPEKTKDVYTIRQVSIRQLRANLAGELHNLPFEIVKNKVLVAVVNKDL